MGDHGKRSLAERKPCASSRISAAATWERRDRWRPHKIGRGDPARRGAPGELKEAHRVLQKSALRRAFARFGSQTFKTKAFARFAEHEGLEDAALCEAVRRAGSGLIDADFGGASSSSGSPARAVAAPAGSARSCCSAEGSWRSSCTVSPRATGRTCAETNWRPTGVSVVERSRPGGGAGHWSDHRGGMQWGLYWKVTMRPGVMGRVSCVDNAGTSISRLDPKVAHALALLKCSAAIFAVHRPGNPATSPRRGPSPRGRLPKQHGQRIIDPLKCNAVDRKV